MSERNQRLAIFLNQSIKNQGSFEIPILEFYLNSFDHKEQAELDRIAAEKQAEEDRLQAIVRKQYDEHRAWLHRNLPAGTVLSECEEHGPWQVVLVHPEKFDGWYIAKTDAKGANHQFALMAPLSRKGGLAKAILECRRRNLKLGYEQKPRELEVPQS